MLHLGLRQKEDTYCIEKQGHRDGYHRLDVDGDGSGGKEAENGGIWESCPEVLETEVDVDRVCSDCRGKLPVSWGNLLFFMLLLLPSSLPFYIPFYVQH